MFISEFLKKENNNLDLMRIILAIMVIIGHCIPLNGDTQYWVDPIQYFFPYTHSGSIAVKLFFFISGLLVTNSYLKNTDPLYYINSRLFRIMPLLFLVLITSVFIVGPILTSLNSGDYFSQLDSFSYLRKNLFFDTQYYLPGMFQNNIYPNVVNGSLWSLRYEVACYIGLLGLFLIFKKEQKNILKIILLIVIIDAFFTKSLIFKFLGYNADINLSFPSFALGALLALNADKVKITLTTVVGTFFIYYIFKSSHFNHTLLIIMFSTIVVYVSSNKHFIKFKPKYDISYGIYLWAFIIQQTIYHYLGGINAIIHCVLAIIVTSFVAFISNIILEKPLILYGKKFYTNHLLRFKK